MANLSASLHAGLEHDVPHEAPHFAVVVGICQVAVFATLGVECGLRRPGRLSGFEDLGGLRLVARRRCGERRVRWDEAFADRCVEHLPESEIVVVDGFASVFLGEFGAHSVDGGGGYSVESHSADDAADGVAVGSIGFEGAGFDIGRDGIEPSLHPFVERWGSGQGISPSRCSLLIFSWSRCRAAVLVGACASTMRRLPVRGFGAISLRACQVPR